MKTILRIFLVIALITTVFTACKKYEDGPMISLRSKKARLCGDWKIESYTEVGRDSTTAFTAENGANWVIDIEKDGKYKIAGTYPEAGTWSMGEHKDDVTFDPSTPSVPTDDRTYRILKLKNKSLWLKQTQPNGDAFIWHLQPAD